MNAGDAKLKLQEILGVPAEKRAPNLGPISNGLWETLKVTPNTAPWPTSDPSLGKIGAGRDISQAAADLIKHFEGLKELRSDGLVEAYWDADGKCWTIGWGHTGLSHKDGTVYKGRTITQAKAEQLFRYDMDQFEARVDRIIKVPLNDNEHGALVSFDFNTGGLILADGKPSTLTRKLNSFDRAGAAAEMLRWNKSGGRVLRGLTRRRYSECRMFLGTPPFVLSLAQLDRVEKGLPV